eukprot:1886322-Pleurochrysis_carterae.AAC.1
MIRRARKPSCFGFIPPRAHANMRVRDCSECPVCRVTPLQCGTRWRLRRRRAGRRAAIGVLPTRTGERP